MIRTEPDFALMFNGQYTPARQLSWAMVASCGCVTGLHSVLPEVATEDEAWKAFHDSAATLKRRRERGFVTQLMRRDEACDRAKRNCLHTPAWNYEPPPTPNGYIWSATLSASRVLHLIPAVAEPAVGVTSLCKSAHARLWSQDPWNTAGKVECKRCVKAGEVSA